MGKHSTQIKDLPNEEIINELREIDEISEISEVESVFIDKTNIKKIIKTCKDGLIVLILVFICANPHSLKLLFSIDMLSGYSDSLIGTLILSIIISVLYSLFKFFVL